MINPWDERYSINEYYYGIEANDFLKEKLSELNTGKILLPAEGEGRNAVYCGKKGWEVDCYDMSLVGKQKALELAKINGVEINYELASHEDFTFGHKYDLIGLFYVHLELKDRAPLYKKLVDLLKVNGSIILEGFSKNQPLYQTFGPKNEEMLFSIAELENDFKDLKIISLTEEVIPLNEGNGHKGISSVIRMVAVKS